MRLHFNVLCIWLMYGNVGAPRRLNFSNFHQNLPFCFDAFCRLFTFLCASLICIFRLFIISPFFSYLFVWEMKWRMREAVDLHICFIGSSTHLLTLLATFWLQMNRKSRWN